MIFQDAIKPVLKKAQKIMTELNEHIQVANTVLEAYVIKYHQRIRVSTLWIFLPANFHFQLKKMFTIFN